MDSISLCRLISGTEVTVHRGYYRILVMFQREFQTSGGSIVNGDN